MHQGITFRNNNSASGRITRLRLALRAVAEATLSSLVLAINSQTLKQQRGYYLGEDGASGRIRTSDRSVRSRVLYPAELRMHQGTAFRNSKWCIREDYSAAPRPGAVAKATLSSLVLTINS